MSEAPASERKFPTLETASDEVEILAAMTIAARDRVSSIGWVIDETELALRRCGVENDRIPALLNKTREMLLNNLEATAVTLRSQLEKNKQG